MDYGRIGKREYAGGVLAYSRLERGGEWNKKFVLAKRKRQLIKVGVFVEAFFVARGEPNHRPQGLSILLPTRTHYWHHSTLSLLPNNRSVALTSGF